MHLVLDGKTLSIGQLGPDFLILDTAIEHPPAKAMLFFSIDGKARQREIDLPDGISMKSRRFAIATALGILFGAEPRHGSRGKIRFGAFSCAENIRRRKHSLSSEDVGSRRFFSPKLRQPLSHMMREDWRKHERRTV